MPNVTMAMRTAVAERARYLSEKVFPLMDAMSLAVVTEEPEDPETFLLKFLLQRSQGDRLKYESIPTAGKNHIQVPKDTQQLHSSLQARVDTLTAENDALRAELNACKEEHDVARGALLEKLDAATCEHAALQGQIADLQVELELLRVRNEDLRNSLTFVQEASLPGTLQDDTLSTISEELVVPEEEQETLVVAREAETDPFVILEAPPELVAPSEDLESTDGTLNSLSAKGADLGGPSMSPKGAFNKLLADAADDTGKDGLTALRSHFLSAEYASGLDMETRDTEYETIPAFGKALQYVHLPSKIQVWRCALELQSAGSEDLEVVFHYTDEDSFKDITQNMNKASNWWAGLERRDAAWGRGVYMSAMEPAQFDSKEAIARNNWAAQISANGLASCLKQVAFCVPILAPKSMVYDVAVRATPDMIHGPGRSLQNKPLGGSDIWVVRCKNEEAMLKDAVGNYEERLRSIIAARDVVFSASANNDADLETLVNIDSLTALLESQGRLAEAEPFCRRKLEMREKTGDPQDPGMLLAMTDLATLLRQREKLAEAEALFRRALDGYQAGMGPMDLSTLASASNLAGCLDEQGKYSEAESLHRHVLEGRTKILGKRHQDTLTSLNNLANSLDEQGRPAEAEVLHRRTLEGRESALGFNHPDTLTSLNNLAACLNDQGKPSEAEPLYRRALRGCQITLGDLHPDTLQSMGNLGALLKSKGNVEEAEALFRKALQGREAILGASHPSTLRSFKRLAALLEEEGRSADLRELTLHFQQRAAGRSEQSL